MLIALSPTANKTYVLQSGATYIADGFGIISNVANFDDMSSLIVAGCTQLAPTPQNLIGKLLGANFNTVVDQQITMFFGGKYRPTSIVATNTSVAGMNTAVGGIYTAAAKGGTKIVNNTQIYTGLTNALTALELTLNAPTLVLGAASPLYFALTTAQGAPATADLFLYGQIYD